MIESLPMKTSDLIKGSEIVGGTFKLTALLQKRVVELMRGDPKLVEGKFDNLIEIALQEVLEEKITLTADYEVDKI
jgi:DNA-directed RNA polymerase subunit K/omega